VRPIVCCATPRARGDGDRTRDDDQRDPDKLARWRPMRRGSRSPPAPRARDAPLTAVELPAGGVEPYERRDRPAASMRPSAPTTRPTTASCTSRARTATAAMPTTAAPSAGAQELAPAANRPGLRHVAFKVDDVRGVIDRVREAGWETVGEIVAVENTFRRPVPSVVSASHQSSGRKTQRPQSPRTR
jgi:hypothetical protein